MRTELHGAFLRILVFGVAQLGDPPPAKLGRTWWPLGREACYFTALAPSLHMPTPLHADHLAPTLTSHCPQLTPTHLTTCASLVLNPSLPTSLPCYFTPYAPSLHMPIPLHADYFTPTPTQHCPHLTPTHLTTCASLVLNPSLSTSLPCPFTPYAPLLHMPLLRPPPTWMFHPKAELHAYVVS